MEKFDNTLAPADLARARQQGLDPNRLLFARFLFLTRRLSDELPPRHPRAKPLAA